MSSKKKAQRTHLKRRFEERFGRPLTKDFRRKMLHLIKSGLTQCPDLRRSLRTQAHIMTVDGFTLKAIYDKQRHEIITAMPFDKDVK